MTKIDTDKLSPTERQALIHQLREDQRLYEQENILKGERRVSSYGS